MMKYFAATILTSTLLAPHLAFSHGAASGAIAAAKPAVMAEETAFGQPGDARKITRTIVVSMNDSMRFTPSDIKVTQGDIVKLVAENDGKLMHEMVLGTMKSLNAHHELMNKYPGMEHDEPSMAHVSPGKREEIVWQFTQPGEFFYACLEPGHLEAGMIGKIVVQSKR